MQMNFEFIKGQELTPDQQKKIRSMNRIFNWTPKMSQDDFNMTISYYLLLSKGDRLYGYIGMHYIIDELEINTVVIHPQYRGRGYGRQLIDQLFEVATKEKIRRIMLEVRSKNTKAIHLYERSGFKQITRRKDYYHEPLDDALIMEYIMPSREEEENDKHFGD